MFTMIRSDFKIRSRYFYWLRITLLILVSQSCHDEFVGETFDADQLYQFNIPKDFPALAVDTVINPVTVNGVALGKKLFYEGRLSRNNTISCGFCHIQEFAFTHHGHSVSHGIDNRMGIRNAPPIQNMAFLRNYTWDGVSHHLDERSLVPITTDFEMDSSLPEVIAKLSSDTHYQKLFTAAFGDDKVTGERILKALSQFMTTLISANSKFDRVSRGTANFTEDESNGYKVFQNNCTQCHSGALFTDQSFRNTGMYYNAELADRGRYRVTMDPVDDMKFRVPSLRNVEYTAPYMHDGRFSSLEAVLNFYSDQVINYPNLDPQLRKNGHIGIALNGEEKRLVISFLKTLSDPEFITNPKFAE